MLFQGLKTLADNTELLKKINLKISDSILISELIILNDVNHNHRVQQNFYFFLIG